MRTGRRTVVGSVISLLLVTTSVIVLPPSAPASGAEAVRPESSCPELTDSIRRLYLAYFNREPDAASFVERVGEYQTGAADLPTISEELARSEEFRTRYGTLSDARFVELVYRNVLRRPPDDASRDYWVRSLATGYPRGRVMIAFSESEDFVRRTATTIPLAGFLRWYPSGAHWYCGVGPAPNLSIRPLTNEVLYADFMFHNGGHETSPIELHTAIDSDRHVTMTEGELLPGFTVYRWDGRFSGGDNYGTNIQVEAGANVGWTVVFYPRSIGSRRLGWQISR